MVMLLFLPATLAGCTTAVGRGDVVRPRLSMNGMRAVDYYPLANGWKWSYSVWKDGVNTRTLFAVIERKDDIAVVQEGDERITYAVTSEGISQKDGDELGDYVLKDPIAQGTEWPVAGGRARIVSVEAKFESATLGRYEGCVLVAVTRTDPTRVTQTWFAPYLGPVLIDIQVQDGKGFLPIATAEMLAVTKPAIRSPRR
jgi:hypothetical protein